MNTVHGCSDTLEDDALSVPVNQNPGHHGRLRTCAFAGLNSEISAPFQRHNVDLFALRNGAATTRVPGVLPASRGFFCALRGMHYTNGPGVDDSESLYRKSRIIITFSAHGLRVGSALSGIHPPPNDQHGDH